MSDPRILQVVIQPDPPARLDKALARDVPAEAALSRSRLARLIADGQVRRGGAVLDDPRARVAAGEVLELTVIDDAEPDLAGEAIPLQIVYEDADLIVIDKPAGMVVHPAPGAPSGTLVNALIAHCGESLSGIGGERRPGIVHRIDKDTSGLLVAAKSDRAHHGLARQFEAHDVERHYRALVHGVPDAGDPPGAALVDCWLETGRTHQIRVHMAHAGHALLGDQTYGARRRLSSRSFPPDAVATAAAFPRQALHAATLGFHHPVTKKWMAFTSALPQDFRDLIAALRGTPV